MGKQDVTTSDLANRSDDSTSADEKQHSTDGDRQPLLPSDQAQQYLSDWEKIQASFVDQPRKSVEQADRLVADLMQRLATGFSKERQQLESQWESGDDVSTEDLRVTLTRYRSFFGRLLST
jgi:hypothetical protein